MFGKLLVTQVLCGTCFTPEDWPQWIGQFQGKLPDGTASGGLLRSLGGVPRQTSKKFASEGFCMEISTPRQLLESPGPLLGASLRTPPEVQLPTSPSMSFSSREGWLENCLNGRFSFHTVSILQRNIGT